MERIQGSISLALSAAIVGGTMLLPVALRGATKPVVKQPLVAAQKALPAPVTPPIVVVAKDLSNNDILPDQPVKPVPPVPPAPKVGVSEMLTEDAQANKFTVLYFGAKWCPHCINMDSNVFPRIDMGSFKLRKFDVDEPGNKELMSKYAGTTSLPAYVIVTKDGQVVHRGQGLQTPQQWCDWANQVIPAPVRQAPVQYQQAPVQYYQAPPTMMRSCRTCG